MNAKREKPGEEKEVFITKKYATMGGFMRGVRNAFIKVFGDDDNLTLIEPGEDRTVEERIRAGEFVTHAEGSKELGYKLGWEIEFPDRIYVYYTPEWKDETEEQEEKNEKELLSDREMRVIERLKMLGVEIDEPPIITTIGKTKTVVGKIDNYRLNFVIGDIQKEDMEEFDTLKIGDKVLWVKKSPMLSMLKEKLRRGEKKPKVMKLVPEYGGLKRFEPQDMTLTEKLQLKYLKEHGNL
ncbi:hypothetical protein DRN97_11265 [Methanosarcinales archaeon]|nr:MAG: hypothetical protein DRN97_11265 [Methanosarcinales archaeon]